MKIAMKFVLGAAAALLVVAAQAGVTFNAGRVGSTEPEALAKYYKTAFGMQEVQRVPQPGHAEIMLNFGASVAAAKANKGAQTVVMYHESDAVKDSVPHLIYNVTDVDATIAAVKAAGGTAEGEPRAFGPLKIGFVTDPAGNRIELLQQPAHK
jgi:predicted enzyme related to lactoylglutathione lyase